MIEEKLEKDKMEVLNEFSQTMAHLSSQEDLAEIAVSFVAKMRKQNLREIHPMVLNALCNNLCAKVLTITYESRITKEVNELIDFMNENAIMPSIFRALMDQLQLKFYDSLYQIKKLEEKAPAESSPEPEEIEEPENATGSQLKMDFKTERYLNKNFGYSLLDLNGDFIWCDSNCEKFFEFKFREDGPKNFFDLMIPFSKNFLTQKFGNELFKEANSIGSAITFAYVIYSMNSVSKFLKCIKKLRFENEEDFHLRMKSRTSTDAIYHQYLKALSSRASLVMLKFTRGELKSILTNQKYSFNLTDSLKDLAAKAPPVAKKIKKRGRKPTIKPDEKKEPCIDDSSTRRQDGNDNSSYPLLECGSDGDTFLRTAILLETRLSMNVPQFDYSKLGQDPIIKSYEQKIIKKVCKSN